MSFDSTSRGRRGSHSLSTYSSDTQQPACPLRKVLSHLQWIGDAKAALLFISLYVAFALISTLRMDVAKGHETLEWLQQAHERINLKPIDELGSVHAVADMLENGIGPVVTELESICRECAVGLTPHAQDMRFMGLESFVCSDFASEANSENYPARECDEADAAWAANPSSFSAPCCKNATLVKASIAMMAQREMDGVNTSPLSSLLGPEADTKAVHYVENHVTRNQFVMQVVISQKQRMAAAQYHASWVDREAAPDRLRTSTTYWSFNYSIPIKLGLLQLLLLLLLVLTFTHDRRMRRGLAARFDGTKGGPNVVNAPSNGYMLLIELPSVLGPALLEGTRQFLPLPTWTFWVTCCEMILSIRLFHDAATVSPALRRIVMVFREAIPNILAYVGSLMPIVGLTALMHGQMFGLFDDGFADYPTAITRVVRYLTAPPPDSTNEPEPFLAIEASTFLLYFWSTFTMRLAYGSFIVAILVGAFNKVIEQEEIIHEEAKRDASLPEGFIDTSNGHGHMLIHLRHFLWCLLTSHAYGMLRVDMVTVLWHEVHRREHADSNRLDLFGGDGEPPLTKSQILMDREDLIGLLGERPAEMLLEGFGVLPPEGAVYDKLRYRTPIDRMGATQEMVGTVGSLTTGVAKQSVGATLGVASEVAGQVSGMVTNLLSPGSGNGKRHQSRRPSGEQALI